jgi:hypothetical protein
MIPREEVWIWLRQEKQPTRPKGFRVSIFWRMNASG